MINPNLKVADRIFENLPAPLKELMREHLLTEEEHEKVLEVIKGWSYRNKKTSEHMLGKRAFKHACERVLRGCDSLWG